MRVAVVALSLGLGALLASATTRGETSIGAVRGITIGPIENGYHPSVGYGSRAYARALEKGGPYVVGR